MINGPFTSSFNTTHRQYTLFLDINGLPLTPLAASVSSSRASCLHRNIIVWIEQDHYVGGWGGGHDKDDRFSRSAKHLMPELPDLPEVTLEL